MRVAGVAVVIVALLGLHGRASAQGAGQAESLFREGTRLRDEGKFDEACEAFAASQRLEPSIATAMNIGNCREKNGQLASAWDAFLGVVRETRDDPAQKKLHDVAKARAAALEKRLSYLTINVADEVRVDGLEVLLDDVVLDTVAWNKSLPIDGGSHVVSGRAPGHEQWSTTVTIEAEADKKSVEVPRFKQIRGEPAQVEPEPEPEPEVVDTSSGGGLGGRRIAALAIAGTGVLAIGIGGVLGVQAGNLQDQADAICPGTECPPGSEEAVDLADRARSRALTADVLFVTGAVAIGTGVILWITARKRPAPRDRAITITPAADRTGASLLVHGVF